MDYTDYLELEIEIGPSSQGEYPVAVASPAGQAQETMPFPLSEQQIERYLEDLQFAPRGSGKRRGDEPPQQEQVVQVFGRALFDSLFNGEVRTLYDASRRQGIEEGKGLRLRLQILPPELVALPWELLYDSRHDEHFCLSHTTPTVRFVEQPEGTQLSNVTPPLRILGMIAGRRDLARSDVQQEKRRLEEATKDLQARGLVDLKWVEGQTWYDLRRMLWSADWHVFHLISDGGLDPNTGEGFVVMADEESRSEHLSAARLSRLLASRKFLRLVTLSPYEGAQEEERDRFSSTAAYLVQRGVPATLNMQEKLTDRAEVAFTRALYAALVATLPLDLAVVEARHAIRSAETDAVEWGIPVFHTHSPDLRLFDREALAGAASRLGAEALASGAFAQAAGQYQLAIAMGAGVAAQEQIELAAEARQTMGAAEVVLSRRTYDAAVQAEAILETMESLRELEQRLPDGPALQGMLLRAEEAALGLRDQLWKDGERLMGSKAIGLSLARQRARMQESVDLLEKARELDQDGSVALQEDLARARDRLDELDAQIQARAERGRRWPLFALLGAAVIGVLLVVVLVFGLARPSGFLAGLLPDATATTSQTAEPTPVAAQAETAAATDTAAPPASPTVEPTPEPTPGATTSPAEPVTEMPSPTASPVPSDTAAPTPMPSSTAEPTATQTETATPPPPPTETATAAARTIRRTSTPASSPTTRPTVGLVYAAPELLQPNDVVFLSQGSDSRYTMRWEWDGTLGADEWFDVRVWQAGKPHHGIAWTKRTEYVYDICLKGNGDFYWSVAVVRGDVYQWLEDLSPESAPRRFSTSRSDEWCERHGRWVQQVLP